MRFAPPATALKVGRAQPGPLRPCGVASLAAACAIALAGCGSASKYPSFLPKRTLDPKTDTALTGTTAKPALTVEGLPVDVKTPAFDVSVTVEGPIVPGEGLPYEPTATTCTWTITMTSASARVPIALADFHVVNHLGGVQTLELVHGERSPPKVLRPGQSVSFQVRAYQLVGEGMMQWAPDQHHPVADWDYEVEDD